MSNFRLGDRVEIIEAYDKDFGAVGQIGTVVGLDDGSIEVSGVGDPVLDGGWYHAPECLRLVGPTYTRDDLIRVVIAQQWAVAIALLAIANETDGGRMYAMAPRILSRFPCAVDVVDGVG